MLTIAALALGLAVGAFLVEGDLDINLADEGHLWYVTTRTALGDVPLRDVRAYDPARYYWGAAWFALLGPGIISLRIGLTAVRALGLAFGLLALRRVVRSWWLLALLGAVLLVWMYPLYKAFESTTLLGLVWLALRLLERPTPARHFAAGAGVGLAAFVRIDHGLYGTLALALLVLVLAARGRPPAPRALAAAGVGLIAGYGPMLVMLAAVPGFAGGFIEHLAYLVRIVAWAGNTNLARPVPWPWLPAGDAGLLDRLRLLAVGGLFVAIPAVYLLAALALRAAREADTPPLRLVLASGALGLMYAHYTFSRADLEHLAQSVHPLVLVSTALVASLGPRWRGTLAALGLALLVVASALQLTLTSPTYHRAVAERDPFVRVPVAGDLLWVRATTAQLFAIVQAADRILGPGERLLVLPHWPALYAVLGREAPLWETYFIYPEREERQRRMIADLDRRNVTLVLFAETFLDGRADLNFEHTHPLVYRHLVNRFEKIPVTGLVPWVHLLRRKAVSPPQTG